MVRITGLFSLVFFLVTACTSSKNGASQLNQDDVIKRAKKQLGVKYQAGGTTPKGFDCSGFTKYVYEPFGIKLPPTAADQARFGTHVELPKAQKADLIFFKGSDHKSKKTGHVGIVIGGKNDNLEFIHASTSKGVIISKLGEEYYKKRFIGIRRVP